MLRFLLLASAVSSICCSTAPVGFGGLKVVVTQAPGLSSRCARVVARGSGERQSTAVVLAGKSTFSVGIAQDGEPVEVEVQALGYADEACTVLTSPAERSESRASRFASPPAEVALTLRLDPADVDGDGFTSDDCDDANAAVNPGATESCTNGVDDDCDLSFDCADLDCVGRSCGMGGTCDTGSCLAPVETGLCSDGIDNDRDGNTDCADSECPQGARCSDSNACTLADTCGAPGVGCVRGTDATCTAPPAGCFEQAGICVPDAGGCTYALLTGSCIDNLFCTQNDTCLSDGGCVGTPRVCDAPPSTCHAATGACVESAMACSYAPLPSGRCDDADNCTVSDTCDGDGGCAGSRVMCTPPGECFTTASTCQADGGCMFAVRVGACDGGACNGAGACMSTPVFSYMPSNFTEAQLPNAPTGAVVVSCNVTIDTRTADGGVSWTTCGTGPAAPPHRVIAAGTNTSVLFFMDSLTLNAGTRLRAEGNRPVIFAVRNAVVINGLLDVDSAGSRGAGSDIDCAAGAGSAGTASGGPSTAGGGGGGGFRTDGTAGSDGANGGPAGGRGGLNGVQSVVPLRGGCRGGNGGRATSTSGVGGRGGGAVQVSAGSSITINGAGAISAAGEGGGGGLVDLRIGGGGGGTGGAIVLEGTTITVNSLGLLVANGGAGGEGSGFGGAQWSGVDGQNGQPTELRAVCISIGACGGNGGSGGALAGDPTDPTGPSCGTNMPGGGGGGSAGRIRLNTVNGCTLAGSAIISPAPTGLGANCP